VPIVKNEIPQSKLDSINWDEIKMLCFVGGEPLYEKKNIDILEKLAFENNECFISIVTNGSAQLSQNQKNTFKKFKNLNICLSIDGIQKQFEYIRYPLKWDVLLKNIEEYREVGASLSVSFTISNLNILYYDEIVNWFNQQKLEYNSNFVIAPKHFNIEVLPPAIKKHLPFIKNPSHFDRDLFSQFMKEIKGQDKLKNIDIKDYLPEVDKIIKDYNA
jgi:sulfatase maturation enzyme AslB (radical SAM superfamily)